jgi:uncharacterized protein (TIGR02466 family)
MDRFSLFSTPVVVFDLPGMEDVNREITERLLEEEKTTPSWEVANIGGWHSVPDLSQRPLACFRRVMQAVVDHVGLTVMGLGEEAGVPPPPQFRYGVQSWAMIMRDGNYTTVHDHGDAHWSIAYYVDAGDDAPPPSGGLAFVDPRRSGRTIPGVNLFQTTFTIKPRNSALVIFPGWLQHFVHTYRGVRPRICISANVTMAQAEPAPSKR